MTNVLEKEFYHFEHNVGGGTSIHHMDAYLKKKIINLVFLTYFQFLNLSNLALGVNNKRK